MVIMIKLLVMEVLDGQMKSGWYSIPPMGSSTMEVFLRESEVKSFTVSKIIFYSGVILRPNINGGENGMHLEWWY